MEKTVSIEVSSFEDAIAQLSTLKMDVDMLKQEIQKMPFAKKTYKSSGKCAEVMRDISETELPRMVEALSSLVQRTRELLQSAKSQYVSMDESIAKELG